MKPIAILGCGPAGLMAAHAVGLAGHPIAIFSKPEKSRLGGAQFLHRPIYMVNDEEVPDAEITYKLRGDAAGYERKVYPEGNVPFVSFSSVTDGQVQPAWNLQRTYDLLWENLGGSVNEADISAKWMEENHDEFALILSTVPLPSICRSRAGLTPAEPLHRFDVQRITIHPECLETIPANTVVYDGTPDRTWYRSSNLFGVGGTEWTAGARTPPLPASSFFHDNKPIATNCDCWPDVVRLGRRGTWTKGVLTHQAFVGALEAVLPDREAPE